MVQEEQMKKNQHLSSDFSDDSGRDCKMAADNVNMGVQKEVSQKDYKVNGARSLIPQGTHDLSNSEDSSDKQCPSGSVQ